MQDLKGDNLAAPDIVDRSTFQVQLDALRIREKAHTRARRRSDGQQLRLARLDRLWAARGVGRFAGRLAARVERQGPCARQRPSHVAVVSTEGWLFGRLGNRPAVGQRSPAAGNFKNVFTVRRAVRGLRPACGCRTLPECSTLLG